jgi:UDP-N-acetyl-D-mannosaminuronate dehydrogenase
VNANELAVYLEDITDWEESPYRQAATMLRQQQAEIGFYKQDADKYKQKCASQQIEIAALKKTIESLFGGLESSLALNKAQTERNQ